MAQPRLPMTIVRASVAAVLILHGVARYTAGTVGGFGFFLTEVRGVPFGHALAWAITVVEIVGGLLLAFGVAVVPLCAWFTAVLVAGIRLVHWPSGWFVVGEGRNGIELSVLLIACLLAIAADAWGRGREEDASRG